jgi:hypothetical protein
MLFGELFTRVYVRISEHCLANNMSVEPPQVIEMLFQLLLAERTQSPESEGINTWNMNVDRKQATWRSESSCCLLFR